MTLPDELPADLAPLLNQNLDGWSAATGLRYVRASADEVEAELTITPAHLQAYGVVHGGVYCGVIETLASVGAALSAMKDGNHVVGMDNQTSFLRAVRGGTLRATARPLVRGRRTHLWQVDIRDEADRHVATGRVRLLCLAPDSTLAGKDITMVR